MQIIKKSFTNVMKGVLPVCLVYAGGCGGKDGRGAASSSQLIQQHKTTAHVTSVESTSGYQFKDHKQQPEIYYDLQTVHDLLGSSVPLDHKTATSVDANFVNCITGSKPTADYILGHSSLDDLYKTDGQVVDLDHFIFYTKRELEKFFNVGAYAEFGMASLFDASVEADYVSHYNESSQDVIETYVIEVRNPEVRLGHPRLTDQAKALLDSKGLRAFYEKCGKKAVVGFVAGGSAKWMYHYRSMESRSSQNSDLQGVLTLKSMGSWAGSGGMNVSQKHQEILKNYQINTKALLRGGHSVKAPLTLSDFHRLSESWPKTVAQNARIISLIYMPYKDLLSGQVHDPYYDEISHNMEIIETYLSRLKKVKMDIILNTFPQTYSEAMNKQLMKIEQLSQKLFDMELKCRRATDLSDCSLFKAHRLFNSFNYKVRARHVSCGFHKKVKRMTSSVCGVKRTECLKFKKGIYKNTKTHTVSLPDITLENPPYRDDQLNRIYRNQYNEVFLWTKKSRYYPHVCQNRNSEWRSPRSSNIVLDFKKTSCHTPYVFHSPPCLSPGSIARQGDSLFIFASTSDQPFSPFDTKSVAYPCFHVEPVFTPPTSCSYEVTATATFGCFGRYSDNGCEDVKTTYKTCDVQVDNRKRPKTCEVDLTSVMKQSSL